MGVENTSNESYTGSERRKVDVEKLQQEVREKTEKEVRLVVTIESMQKSLELQNKAISDMAASNSAYFQNIEKKLEEHKTETEDANRREFSNMKNAIAVLQNRVDPIELDYLRREKEKSDNEKALRDRIEHGKKTAIGAIVVAALTIAGAVSLWIYNAMNAGVPKP